MSTQATEGKRLSHRQMLILLFRDGLWHSMRDVQAAGGWRYSARIKELRDADYRIETRNVFGDVFEYRWNREPEQADLFAEDLP